MTTEEWLRRRIRRAARTGRLRRRGARRAQRSLIGEIRNSFSPTSQFLSAVLMADWIEEPDGYSAPARRPVIPPSMWREVVGSLPQPVVDAMCEEALRPDREELRDFCIEQRLMPADGDRRAVFLCITGQRALLREIDPHGTSLQRGYDAASDVERFRITNARRAHD